MNQVSNSLELEEYASTIGSVIGLDNTIEFSFQDNQLSVAIDNPWVSRGHDDDGLGMDADIVLNAEQVNILLRWLQGVIKDEGCNLIEECIPAAMVEMEILCCSDGYYHHRTPIRNDEKLPISCDMLHYLPLSQAAFVPENLAHYCIK